jgi:hypothetical protein
MIVFICSHFILDESYIFEVHSLIVSKDLTSTKVTQEGPAKIEMMSQVFEW